MSKYLEIFFIFRFDAKNKQNRPVIYDIIVMGVKS